MTLFISNPTKQHVTFHFRTDFTGEAKTAPSVVEIASGCQVEVGHGWSAEQMARVIKQLEKRGARDTAEAHGDMGKFLGLTFRENFQIEADEIAMAHDHVVKTQVERSATQATRGALAFDRNANKGARGKRMARVTEVTVTQELEPHQRPTGDEVAFSMSVDPDGRQDAAIPV